MSDFDKAIAALVAVEVNKQLGERNSLPFVKRAAVTADQWKALVLIEAWDLMYSARGKGDGWLQIELSDEWKYPIWGVLSDAAFNITAPARFGKSELSFGSYPEYFEVVSVPDDTVYPFEIPELMLKKLVKVRKL